MLKRDFVSAVADKCGLTKKDAAKAVDAVFETLEELLGEGDRLQVTGFGTFKTRVRPARISRDPNSGDPMLLPQATVAVFEPGKQLRERVDR